MTVYIDKEYGNAVSLPISGMGNKGRSDRQYKVLIEEYREFYYPPMVLKSLVYQ